MANEQGYGSKDDLSAGTTMGKQDQSGLQSPAYDKTQSSDSIKGEGDDLGQGDIGKGQQGYGSGDVSGKGQDYDTTDPQVTKTPDDDGRQTFGDDKLRTAGQSDDLSQGKLGKSGDPAEGKSGY